jgi:hypothetical protein
MIGTLRAVARRGMRAARAHWLLAVLMLAGAALRVLATLAYYPAILYVDSFAYIDGVAHVRAAGSDPVGYSALLLRPVLAAGNLTAVAVAQHVLGMAMAVAVYALLRRYEVRRWIAALAVAPVLLDAYQVQIEENVLSDTLFEAVVVAGLVVLAWRARPALWRVSLGVFLLGLSVTVRTVGELLIVPALVFAVIATRGWRRPVAMGLACASFALPVAAYGAYHYAEAGSVGLSSGNGLYLYARAATVADCARLRLPADEMALCPRTPLSDRMGVDSYAHSTSSPVRAILSRPDADSLERGFAIGVMEQQPVAFALSVGRDVLHGFAVDRTHSPGDTPASRWQFQTYYVTWPPYSPAATSASYGQGSPHVDAALTRVLRDYQLGGGYTPGPFLALCLLLGIAGCVLPHRSGKSGLAEPNVRSGLAEPNVRSGLRSACALFTLGCLGVLGLADLFEYSLRYQMPVIVILPAAGALGLSALARRRRTGVDHSSGSGSGSDTAAAVSGESAESSAAADSGSASARMP